MIRVRPQCGSKTVFCLGDMTARVVRHPEGVLCVGVIGVEAQGLTLINQRFLRSLLSQHGEAEVYPSFLELRIQLHGSAIVEFRFRHSVTPVELQSKVVCFGWVHTAEGCTADN